MIRASSRMVVRVLVGIQVVFGLACVDAGVDPKWVAAIWFDLDSLHLEVGEMARVDVHLIDQSRTPIEDLLDKVHWGVNDSSLVEIQPEAAAATLRALEPGGVVVSAELGRGFREIPVWVRPTGLASVEVFPNPLQIDVRGGARAEVRLLDSEGRTLDPQPFRIGWRAETPRLLRIPVDSAASAAVPIAGQGLIGSTALIVTVNHLQVRVPVQIVDGGAAARSSGRLRAGPSGSPAGAPGSPPGAGPG